MSNQPLKDLVDSFGAEVVEAAMRNLGATRKVRGGRMRRAVATGNLKDSLVFKNVTRYNNPIIQFSASGSARDYAIFVHDGRRPLATPPPIAPILKWINDKKIRPRVNGKFVKSTPERLRSMAFGIAKSIGRRGIAPLPFYNEAIESVLEKRGPEFLEALKKEIDIMLLLASPNYKVKSK